MLNSTTSYQKYYRKRHAKYTLHTAAAAASGSVCAFKLVSCSSNKLLHVPSSTHPASVTAPYVPTSRYPAAVTSLPMYPRPRILHQLQPPYVPSSTRPAAVTAILCSLEHISCSSYSLPMFPRSGILQLLQPHMFPRAGILQLLQPHMFPRSPILEQLQPLYVCSLEHPSCSGCSVQSIRVCVSATYSE